MTKILDTTASATGTEIQFSDADKKNPQTITVGLSVAAGDELSVYTKISEQPYKSIKTYTASEDISFNSVPDYIRVDRTTDGGSGDSTAYISQVY
jgi:hypothetical protein